MRTRFVTDCSTSSSNNSSSSCSSGNNKIVIIEKNHYTDTREKVPWIDPDIVSLQLLKIPIPSVWPFLFIGLLIVTSTDKLSRNNQQDGTL